jgi:predicted glycoside hydrolase/deacetylase ChbG (UPF0249 family)
VTARRLIVNADDFGLSEGTNRGILRAHDEGIVTSASLMVRQPAAAPAVAEALRRPRLSLGLHLDLGEWEYRDRQWAAVYEVVPGGDAEAVAAEARRQLDEFVRLVGRPPTHVDSHQHAHRSEPLRSVALAMTRRLGVPLRHFAPEIRYCGDFYGQGGKGEPLPELITPAALARVVRSLPPGVTELACHPGDDPELPSVYRHERMVEVATLCDRSMRSVLREEGVELVSFADFAGRTLRSI